MAAECREIGRRAERNIERIVDAAEAESFRDLRIETKALKTEAESCSRQLKAWAQSLQDSEFKGDAMSM